MRLATVILGCLSCAGLAQCSNKNSLSKGVKFKSVPDTPIVINTDMTVHAGQENEFKVKAPWFEYKSRIENNSNKILVLVTFDFNIKGIFRGAPTTSTASLDPNKLCDSTSFSGGVRPYLAVLAPGEVYQNLNTSYDTLYPAVTPQTGSAYHCQYFPSPHSLGDFNSAVGYESWYIDGLPAADTYNYIVDIAGQGWFEDDSDVPVERLVMSGTLFTQ